MKGLNPMDKIKHPYGPCNDDRCPEDENTFYRRGRLAGLIEAAEIAEKAVGYFSPASHTVTIVNAIRLRAEIVEHERGD
jgi:hypothetical protein